ncbi:MAG: FecR domain-containing protein, partial [Spirochaetales bacterium]|nr:FecR domain-containing protein [Spirochaetales bacterium]
GTVIKTGTDSHVEIVLPDGSLLILQSDTYVVLDQVYFKGKDRTAKTSISLGVGRVRSIVKKMTAKDSHYEIRTPSGAAGVRGTDFGVSYSSDDKRVEIIVLSGNISLKTDKGKELAMGSDTIASIDSKGELSRIKSLNSKSRSEFIQEIPINTAVSEGMGNRFPALLPIVLRIIRTWDSMSYEGQQEFMSIMDNSIELESLIKDLNLNLDLEGM